MSRPGPIGENGERRKDVGSLLRASRLRCGEGLEDIAQILRIRRRHLQAIEDGDFASLPGRTYAVGFIRAYANYLGLDSDEVVRRFKEDQAPAPGAKTRKDDLVFPSPMSDSGVPRGALVFLGVIFGLVAYGAWYESTVDNSFFKKWIEPVPSRLASLVSNGDTRSAPPPAAADQSAAEAAPEPAVKAAEPAIKATEPAMPAATAETPAPAVKETAEKVQAQAQGEARVQASAPAPAAPKPAAEVAPSTAQPAAGPVTPGPEPVIVTPAPAEATTPPTETAAPTPAEAGPPARIVITAISDSWVEIRQVGTDEWVWGKLLRQGETYAVPDRNDIKMKTGNAGGLTISVDGAAAPAMGASGEVIRNVLMDPDRLKAGNAVLP